MTDKAKNMNDRAKDIFNMHNLYRLDQKIPGQKNGNMGNYIHENFHKMDETEKKIICSKIISTYDLDKILLNYEMNNLDFDQKIGDTHKLLDVVDKLLKKYHHKAGGFLFEDNMWRLYESTSGQTKYDLCPNEYIFDNSIKMIDVEDQECYTFVNSLVSLFSRITDSHKIRYKYIEDKYENIYWVIIKITSHLPVSESDELDM